MTGPERRSPRLRKFDYAADGAYFVTVCTHRRACLFGDATDDGVEVNALGHIVTRAWQEIPRHFPGVALDVSVVMPNHIHGIVWLARAGHGPPLQVIVGLFKGAVTKFAGRTVWQRSFYDRVIRDDDELAALRQYIADNPVKWAIDSENPER